MSQPIDVFEPTPISAQLSTIVEVPEAPEAPKAEESSSDWSVGSWRGFTQHRCAHCSWDTLDGEDSMHTHLATAHAPPVPESNPEALSGLVDRFGNPL